MEYKKVLSCFDYIIKEHFCSVKHKRYFLFCYVSPEYDILLFEVIKLSIPENIKKIRKEKGLTQKELGKLCGMADSAIRRYESGRANPKIKTLIKIAEALNCEVSDIDENIVITHHVLHPPKLTPERLEQFKKDAEARELIERQKSGETLTNEEQQKILDYGNRIKEDWENLPKFKETIKKFSNAVDKWGENILLADYRELNSEGRSEAIKRVRELTEIQRYTKPDTPPQE